MAPSDARFVQLSNGKTVLRVYSQYSITLTAPAGKVIYNVKISGGSINSSNTSVENASINSNGGVYTIIPDYETNTCVIKILNQVEYSYMTVTYADAYVPEELYYVTNNGDTFTAMTVDESNSKIFVAKEAQIGEWGKKGTIKFSEAGASYLLSMRYSCGAPAEGTTAESGQRDDHGRRRRTRRIGMVQLLGRTRYLHYHRIVCYRRTRNDSYKDRRHQSSPNPPRCMQSRADSKNPSSCT